MFRATLRHWSRGRVRAKAFSYSIHPVCLLNVMVRGLKKKEMVNKENVLVVNKKKKVLECIEVDSRSPTDMIRDCIESHENHVTSFLRILSQFKI